MNVPNIPKRKKTTGNYFTAETQEWIERYRESDDDSVRNHIYTKYLHKPFKKIAEIYYNTLSVPYIEGEKTDIINDCIAHMITNSIYRFKGGKGKAFSYLSISARNYYIQLNDRYYTQFKNRQSITSSYDESEDIYDESPDIDLHNEEIRLMFENFREYLIQFSKSANINKAMKRYIDILVDYMDSYDFDDLRINKYINTTVRKKYNVTENFMHRFKPFVTKLWDGYKKEYQATGMFPKYVSSGKYIRPVWPYTIS